jgi:hypothetical protein
VRPSPTSNERLGASSLLQAVSGRQLEMSCSRSVTMESYRAFDAPVHFIAAWVYPRRALPFARAHMDTGATNALGR